MSHSIREEQVGARCGQHAANWHARIGRVVCSRIWPDVVRAQPGEHQRCDAGSASCGARPAGTCPKRSGWLAHSRRVPSRQPRIRNFLDIVGAVIAPCMAPAQRSIPSIHAGAFLIDNLILPRWLIARIAGTALFALVLAGCGPEPQAPSPTLNPHPHEFTKLRIAVEPRSGVTGVKVESLWNVGNIGCAPHEGWPSGASITKQVDTLEHVEQVTANEWVATIVDDRFLSGKCQWHGDGYGIRFMHDGAVLSSRGTGKNDIEQVGVLKLACTFNEPHGWPGGCFNRDLEETLKTRDAHLFNATVELAK